MNTSKTSQSAIQHIIPLSLSGVVFKRHLVKATETTLAVAAVALPPRHHRRPLRTPTSLLSQTPTTRLSLSENLETLVPSEGEARESRKKTTPSFPRNDPRQADTPASLPPPIPALEVQSRAALRRHHQQHRPLWEGKRRPGFGEGGQGRPEAV